MDGDGKYGVGFDVYEYNEVGGCILWEGTFVCFQPHRYRHRHKVVGVGYCVKDSVNQLGSQRWIIKGPGLLLSADQR